VTDDRFARARTAEPPDLWPEIERRIATPGASDAVGAGLDRRGTAGHHAWRTGIGAALALAIVAASLAFTWSAFRHRAASETSLAASAPAGAIVVRLGMPGTAPSSPTGPDGLPVATVTYGAKSTPMGIDSVSGDWPTPGDVAVFPRILLGFGSELPAGARIAFVGDAESVSVQIGRSGPDHVTLRPLSLRGGVGKLPVQPGEYYLQVDARWQNGTARFDMGIDLGGPAMVITMTFPSGSSALPSATLNYRGTTSSMKLDCSTVHFPPNPAPLCTLELPVMGTVRPGTPVRVTGNASSVELHIARMQGNYSKHWGSIELDDGGGRLPTEPGAYVLQPIGTWPQGTAGFIIGVPVGP
jgi:hypothetical protein